MRPILVSIPAKLLFVAALVLAVAALLRDVIRRRRDKTVPWSSTRGSTTGASRTSSVLR